MGPPGLQRNPPGSGWLWAHFAGARQRGLRKFAVSGKLIVAKLLSFRATGLCRPAFRGGFCVSVVRYRGLAKKGTHTRPIPCVPRACPIIVSPSTRQAVMLARRSGVCLDDRARVQCSWESEQSKNEVGRMVPLYAVRVQDLGPDDVAVFKCGACGHTAELWPSALLRGLGLKPTDKVLDLERRLTETVERRSNTRYGTGMVADQPAREADQYQTHCHGASTGRL